MRNKFFLLVLVIMLGMFGFNEVFAGCFGTDPSVIDIIDYEIVEKECIKISTEGEKCDSKPDSKMLYHNVNDLENSEWLTEEEYNKLRSKYFNPLNKEFWTGWYKNFEANYSWHPLLEVYIRKSVLPGGELRELFSPKGSDIYLITFDSEIIDLYREEDVEWVEQYTKTKKIWPIYSDRGGPADVGGEADDITKVPTKRLGEASSETYSFFVCLEHSSCPECKRFVAAKYDGYDNPTLSDYLNEVRINKYCAEAHACLFFWKTCNTNNSQNDNKNMIMYQGASPRFVTQEGLECLEEKREDNEWGESYFCARHTCDHIACQNPISGVNLIDGTTRKPTPDTIYSGDDINYYSNYCLKHLCWERFCQAQRIAPQTQGKTFDDTEDVYAKHFPEYCLNHNKDCTAANCQNGVLISDYENDDANGNRYLCPTHMHMNEETIILQKCGNCHKEVQQKFMYSVKTYYGMINICDVCYNNSKGNYFNVQVGMNVVTVKKDQLKPNSEVQTPGEEDTGTGNSGTGNSGTGNSGTGNSGTANCNHDYEPVTNVRFEILSDKQHRQYWNCSGCGIALDKPYDHMFKSGVCVCGATDGTYQQFPGGNGQFPGGNEGTIEEENEQVIVSFDANGGKGRMQAQLYYKDIPQRLNANTFTKEGYEFVGWAINPNAYGTIMPDEALFLIKSEVKASNLTLYAVWEINKYTVTFDANGGKGEMPTQEFTKNESEKLIANKFTNEGAEFIGWSTTEDGKVEYMDETYFLATEDTTLYAVWEFNEYTITFDANSGDGENLTQKFYKETAQNLTANTFTKESYKFIGWSTTPNGKVEFEDEASYIATSNKTLYAVWDVDTLWNEPVLGEGLIPVNWTGREWVDTTVEEWDYNYNLALPGHETVTGDGSGKWANARTSDGSMYVWIPRYTYKIISGKHEAVDSWNSIDLAGEGRIDIRFSDGITDDLTDDYLKHPAFIFGEDELRGIWVAKYEASRDDATSKNEGNGTTVTSKPGVVSWRNISVSEAYDYSYNLNRALDSHLMKNSEWGAVAYLTNAIGKTPYINNIATYLTGNAGESQDAKKYERVAVNEWDTVNGVKASTTHNVYGIYDLSGCGAEYVSAYYTKGNSRYTSDDVNNKKYAGSLYEHKDTKYVEEYNNAYSSYITGDALYETSGSSVKNNSWDKDSSNPLSSPAPVIIRGGTYSDESTSGIYYFNAENGGSDSRFGFRPVLAIY